MADVPLSLAVISTITPVVAGALPLAVGWFREAGRDRRAAAERLRSEQLQLAEKKGDQCVKLLGMARDFRMEVEITYDATGPELDAHAQHIRQSATGIARQADNVEFMIPEVEKEALSLARSASRLAATIADRKNRTLGSSLLSPDFTEFDLCFDKFKQAALAAAALDRSGTPGIRLSES